MKNEIIQEAEFISRLQDEVSVKRLEGMLPIASIETILPILRRLNELLGEGDAELLLSLAIRSFHQGDDDEALSFLSKAKLLQPTNHSVLRVALFFAMSVGEGDAQEIGNHLLMLFPHDQWAATMQKKLRESGTDFLNLPPLETKWETMIRGEEFGTTAGAG